MQRQINGIQNRPYLVFLGCFVLLFCLYFQTRNSGWVSDTLGWLDAVRNQPFREYMNRSHFGVQSFYQTTQFITWLLYQLFGTNTWAWHLFHLALHALNCTLLFSLVRGLLIDSAITPAGEIALEIALLFCCSPYVSEVIVWKAAFHYLQGLAFIFSILLILRNYLHQPTRSLFFLATMIFAVSIFSLELFYLIPLFTILVLAYYYWALKYPLARIRTALLYILGPQVLLFLVHLGLVHFVLGTQAPRLGNALFSQPLASYAIKPPLNLFHLFGGRFYTHYFRDLVYHFFCTYWGAGLFYTGILGLLLLLLIRFKKLNRIWQIFALCYCCLLASIVLVSPMWFPLRLLIQGDRYLYVLLPFFIMGLVLLIRMRPKWRAALVFGLALIQSGLTLYENGLWRESYEMTQQLELNFPEDHNHPVLLLNPPQSLQGAAMIGSGSDGEFRLMHRLLYGSDPGNVQEVLAVNLRSLNDHIQTQIVNDSTLLVTAVGPGRYWWYGPDYAKDYAAPDFQVKLMNPQTYELQVHGKLQNYRLRYQESGIWKELILRGK